MRSAQMRSVLLGIVSGIAGLCMAFESLAQDSEPAPTAVTVEFTGMNTSANLLRLMTHLHEKFGEDVIGTRTVTVEKGDTVCRLLTDQYDLIGCPGDAALALAAELNKGGGAALNAGDQLVLPNIMAENFFYSVKVDDSDFSVSRGHTNILKDPNWAPLITRQLSQEFGQLVQLMGKRIQLRPSSSQDVSELLQAIYDVELDDATVYVTGGSKGGRQLYSHTTVARKAEQCRAAPNGGGAATPEGAYWTMLESLSDWEPPSCAMACASGDGGIRCPQIVLMDTLVHPHPDLAAVTSWVDTSNAQNAYIAESCSGEAVQNTDENCSIVDFNKQCHHGTSMASILVDQPNQLGFIGMAPAARVFSLNWLSADYANIPQFLERRAVETNFRAYGPHLYVFASKFPNPNSPNAPIDDSSISYANQLVSNNRLKDIELRLKPPIIKKIGELKDLWITAAGQPSIDGGAPIEIDELSVVSPMNLGFLPNVVVVTACDPCEGPDRKLWDGANFSKNPKLVNVAAPGFGYVTAGNRGAYAKEHGGTSQATAFVAGVAASMISCDAGEFGKDGKHAYLEADSHQLTAFKLKKRLILTSTPIAKPNANGAVASGIVDPVLALKDPSKSWFLRRNPDTGEEHQEMSARWCKQADLTFYPLDEDGSLLEPKSISRENTHRIRAEGDGDQRRWFIYSVAANPDIPEVTIHGPVILKLKEQNIIRANDLIYKPNDFDDLVLAKDHAHAPAVECPSDI